MPEPQRIWRFVGVQGCTPISLSREDKEWTFHWRSRSGTGLSCPTSFWPPKPGLGWLAAAPPTAVLPGPGPCSLAPPLPKGHPAHLALHPGSMSSGLSMSWARPQTSPSASSPGTHLALSPGSRGTVPGPALRVNPMGTRTRRRQIPPWRWACRHTWSGYTGARGFVGEGGGCSSRSGLRVAQPPPPGTP